MSHARVVLWTVIAVFCAHTALHVSNTFADAGFSLAAADALAHGQGLSPWSGAPWAESFDRPLWVALLAGLALLGVDVTLAAKLWGLVLGAASLGLTAVASRQLGGRGVWPGLAALGVALHPWWAVWTVSGSGEVLAAVLVLAGIVRLGLELGEDDRRPLAGVWLGLAAMARWDAVVALAPLGVLGLVLGWSRRTWLGWTMLGLLGPGLAWVGFRLWAFDAWASPWWSHGGTLFRLGPGAAGRGMLRYLSGTNEWLRWPVALGGVAGLVLGLRKHGNRTVAMLLAAGILGELAALFLTSGDWVSTGRKLHAPLVLAMPLAVMAVRSLWHVAAEWRGGRALVVAGGLAVVVGQLERSVDAAAIPETSLAHLDRRVDHVLEHARSLGLVRVSLADPDPQAWLLRTDFPVMDSSGRSSWWTPQDRKSFAEAVFAPDGPTDVHLHGGWAKMWGLGRDPRWEAMFVEIPGYPLPGGGTHVGTYVRRDVLERGE